MAYDIKKINVRSPYYITVGKSAAEIVDEEPDDVIIGDDADTDATETQVTEEEFLCGANKSVGQFVGIKKYNISALGRSNGDYTVSFSSIKTPIFYRIGLKSTLSSQSLTLAGLDTYETQLISAVSSVSPGSLSSAASNPNGVSVTATYTSTSDDDIMLEIQHPIITDSTYGFSLSCPAIATAPALSDGSFILAISCYVSGGGTRIYDVPMTVNGTSVGDAYAYNGSVTGSEGRTRRFIFSDSAIPIAGNNADSYMLYNSSNINFMRGLLNIPSVYLNAQQISYFKNPYYPSNPASRPQVETEYEGLGVLNDSASNTIKITTPTSYSNTDKITMGVVITRHPIVDIGGTLTIMGNGDGYDLTAIHAKGTLYGASSEFTIKFTGSNSTELSSQGILATVNSSNVTSVKQSITPEFFIIPKI
jgi:hypothetical protein